MHIFAVAMKIQEGIYDLEFSQQLNLMKSSWAIRHLMWLVT